MRRLILSVGLLMSLTGCRSEAAPPSPPPTFTPSPSVASSCQSPTSREVAPYFGKAVGGSPVWAAGGLVENPVTVTGTPDSPGATKKKVLWLIEPDFAEPVQLRGTNHADGAQLWFEIGGGTPTREPTLDPQQPGIPVQHGQWREWPSYLYVPTPGCYTLEATWSSGSRSMTFVAR